jgi:hypothetical protein
MSTKSTPYNTPLMSAKAELYYCELREAGIEGLGLERLSMRNHKPPVRARGDEGDYCVR